MILNNLDFQLVIFILVSFALVLLLISMSYLLASNRPDSEKLSVYECGFEPYEDARLKFDIRFYLVSLLFILFDLEVSYLFPVVVVLDSGYFLASVFIVILTIGFIFELNQGVLDNI